MWVLLEPRGLAVERPGVPVWRSGEVVLALAAAVAAQEEDSESDGADGEKDSDDDAGYGAAVGTAGG